MKDKSLFYMAMIGACLCLGYKYIMQDPKMKKEMKNMTKASLKKMYEKVDEMD